MTEEQEKKLNHLVGLDTFYIGVRRIINDHKYCEADMRADPDYRCNMDVELREYIDMHEDTYGVLI